jgi:exosortase A
LKGIEFKVAPCWRVTLGAAVVLFTVLVLAFWPTVSGMVHTWYNFETYTHGFLVLPITLWLVWHKRRHLAAYTPQPTPALLLLTVGALIAWILARLTGVNVVEQAAFVGVVVSVMAALVGWQVARFLAFPLLFLFFAVPMGEDLIPPMMEFTATFTVEALRLTGIPVYREGLWFSLPSGNWSVVEACSGVRYLIASVTLGVMYAYITYHTLWKRILFVVMSALVPILANGVRAYMIVMIGHLSDMKLAAGVDHLLYGWVFFGIVMFILFWIGSFWQEHEAPPDHVPPVRELSSESVSRRVLATATVALLAVGFTVYAGQRLEAGGPEIQVDLVAPDGRGGWRELAEPVGWSAAHQPTEHKIERRYRAEGAGEVQLFLVLFPRQGHAGEAINPGNRIAADAVRWTRLTPLEAKLGDEPVRVNRSRLLIEVDGRVEEHQVWQWYRVAGRSLINRYEGKAWEALARIYPGRSDGAWIAVSTPFDPLRADAADALLAEFAGAMAPAIDAAIDRAVGFAE